MNQLNRSVQDASVCPVISTLLMLWDVRGSGRLVALLRSLPPHMSFVLIEHDLDIALRVVERVTVMHNGRVLRTGSPAEIENDAQVQAIYMGSKH